MKGKEAKEKSAGIDRKVETERKKKKEIIG
jgi:hypothetical protein